MKLYEIAQEYKGLVDLVDSGELSQDDIADTLEAVNTTFEDKVKACMMICRQAQASRDALIQEANRIRELSEAKNKESESMLDYVKSCMVSMDKSKVDVGLFKLTLKKAGLKLGDINEEKVPAKYWAEIPASKKLDKRLLLSDAKLNEIDGVEVMESSRSLMVK